MCGCCGVVCGGLVVHGVVGAVFVVGAIDIVSVWLCGVLLSVVVVVLVPY